MKRYFIILIALIVLFALPLFAGTPTAENVPATSEEDAWLWLNSLSEEELIQIFGQIEVAAYDPNITEPTIEYSEWKNVDREFIRIVVTLLRMGYRIFDVPGWYDSILLGIENDWTISEIIWYQLTHN